VNLPSVALLESAWASVFDTPSGGFNHGILAYAAALRGGAGMPVVLTEHGSIPYDETTLQPYSQARVESDGSRRAAQRLPGPAARGGRPAPVRGLRRSARLDPRLALGDARGRGKSVASGSGG